jgi:serine/threonine protein kinase
LAELVIAILFLHSIHIVHQDIKPANVMVSHTGHVVISDFGASSSLPRDGSPVVLSPTDIVTFTPFYAAPEILHRDDDNLVVFDEAIDWYSFGITLYELAFGTLPYKEEVLEGRVQLGDYSLYFSKLEGMASSDAYESQLEDFIRSVCHSWMLESIANYRLR